MTVVVAAFGAVVVGIGIFGLLRPEALIHFIESVWESPSALHVAVGMRLVLGVVLLVAAPECRYPQAVQVLGILSIVAAISGAMLGRERLTAFVGWWVERPAGFIRGWSVIAAVFGGLLFYVAT